MRDTTITFRGKGYDPFIDYLKGISIFWVVMTHAINPIIHDYILFCLWGDLAVPIFLLIQSIHIYKKDNSPIIINWEKIWNRVIKPFLFVQLFIFLVGISARIAFHKSYIDFVEFFVYQGGTGRGSYYVKMYLQFAILIPIFYPIFKKNIHLGGGILLMVSLISEIIFSYYDYYTIWQWICFRYLFILYLGYMVAKRGINLNTKTLCLSAISITIILMLQYSDYSYEPIFYDNPWKIFHWPVYFYVAYLLIYLLFISYKDTHKLILNIILLMGKYSYEIFLFQMIVFFISDMTIRTYAFSLGYISSFIYILFTISFSICPVLLYKHYIIKLNKK